MSGLLFLACGWVCVWLALSGFLCLACYVWLAVSGLLFLACCFWLVVGSVSGLLCLACCVRLVVFLACSWVCVWLVAFGLHAWPVACHFHLSCLVCCVLFVVPGLPGLPDGPGPVDFLGVILDTDGPAWLVGLSATGRRPG